MRVALSVIALNTILHIGTARADGPTYVEFGLGASHGVVDLQYTGAGVGASVRLIAFPERSVPVAVVFAAAAGETKTEFRDWMQWLHGVVGVRVVAWKRPRFSVLLDATGGVAVAPWDSKIGFASIDTVGLRWRVDGPIPIVGINVDAVITHIPNYDWDEGYPNPSGMMVLVGGSIGW